MLLDDPRSSFSPVLPHTAPFAARLRAAPPRTFFSCVCGKALCTPLSFARLRWGYPEVSMQTAVEGHAPKTGLLSLV